MDFCAGFYGILPQISRKPAIESADLISAEACFRGKWQHLKIVFFHIQKCISGIFLYPKV